MDRNVEKHIPNGLPTYQNQLSRLREIRKRSLKNKQEFERMQREKQIGKEDIQTGDQDKDGEVLVTVEGAVEGKGANEDADTKDDVRNQYPSFMHLMRVIPDHGLHIREASFHAHQNIGILVFFHPLYRQNKPHVRKKY